MATQDDYIRTALRVPRDLHKALHESASKSNRTFNAEIIARLQDSFDENFVTVIEARAKPGPESKHFDFNADEIANKVIEKLESRGKSKAKREPRLDTMQLIERIEGPIGPIQESYLEYVRDVLEGRLVQFGGVAPKATPNKGPVRSPNARKPVDKK